MRPPHTRPLLPWIYVALTALGIGLILLFALESTPTASVDLSIDRDRAGQLAAEFLRSRGDDPDTRWSTTSYGFDSDAQSYLLRESGRDTLNQRAEADLNLARWTVRFWRPLDPDEWSVALSSRTGQILGFSHAIRAEEPGATLPITAAQRLALDALPLPEEQLTLIERRSETQPGRVDHTFTWERTDLRDAEARYRYSVRVQGDRVDALGQYFWLPDSWWREGAWQYRRGGLLSTVGWTLTYALTALIGLTWLLEARRGRLRRRWALTLFLTALAIGVLVMLNSVSLDLAGYNVNDSLIVHIGRRIGGYLGELGAITATIILAGMAGEALVWQRTGGALSMSQTLTRRGLVSRPVVQALLIGGLVGVVQLGFVSAFYALGGRWFGVWSPVTALYDNTLSTPFPALYALAIGILPAIGEELLFRLGGISVLARWTGKPWLAVVFTAIVWASLHATYPQRPFFIRMLELSLVGIGFGYLFLRYGVLASMAAHFTYNASLYVPLFWGGSLLYLISGIVAAAAVGLLLLPALIRRLRGTPLEPDEAVAAALPQEEPEPPAAPPVIAPRRNWPRLLAAAALAGLALAAVGWRMTPPLPRADTRASIIPRSQAAAASLGVDLSGLHPSPQPTADWVDLDLSYLYDELDPAEAQAAVATAGQRRAWSVRWSAWDRPDSWQAEFGPVGELLAFRRSLAEDDPGATIPITQAQTLAGATLAQRADPAAYELLDAGTAQRSARTDHTFIWQTRQPVVGAAYRRIEITVQGDQIGSYTPSLYTPPDYRRERGQSTLAGSTLASLQAGLTDMPTILLPIIGLVGVLRRRAAIRPWALLGLAVGCITLLLGVGRISAGQWAEAPRLIQALAWALGDALAAGGETALMGAGAATVWSLARSSGRKPAADPAEPERRYPPAESLLAGLLLSPFVLLWTIARAWPGPKPGLLVTPSSLASLLPALDILGRAIAYATTNALLLAGSYGMLALLFNRLPFIRRHPGRAAGLALALTTLGMLLSSANLREPTALAATLLAWPLALLLARELRGNLLALWWAIFAARLISGGVALLGSAGPAWTASNGGILLAGLAGLAGWAAGKWIEGRRSQESGIGNRESDAG